MTRSTIPCAMTSSYVRRRVRAALYAGITTTTFCPFNIEVVEYAFMPKVATLMIIFHDPHCVEYSAPGHPERPARITRTVPSSNGRPPNWECGETRTAT